MKVLYGKIKEILDTERIGVPVFVRCSAQIESDSIDLKGMLTKMLAMVCSWIEADPMQIYVQSGKESKQLSVTTHHTGGQTSILNINTAPKSSNDIDLMLLGNRGALYYDMGTGAPGMDMSAEPLPVPERLTDAVERSLNTKGAVTVQEVAN